MGKRQSKVRGDELIEHYSEFISTERIVHFKKAKIPLETNEPGTWRTDLIQSLTHRSFDSPESTWIPCIVESLYNWDVSLDVRWRENVRWFLSSPFVLNQEQEPEVRFSKWTIPGIENKNIFQADSLAEFIEDNLNYIHSHAIASMIQVFRRRFLEVYSPKVRNETVRLHFEVMKDDIIEFSMSMTDALKRYYSPLNILKLIKKPESYLTFVIRKKLLEHEAIMQVLLMGISEDRREEELLYMLKLDEHRTSDINRISPEVSPILVEVAETEAELTDLFNLLTDFVTSPGLQEKLNIVFKLTEATTLAVDSVMKDRKAINLSADDMLILYAFFILRARVPNLGSHLELLDSMVSFDQMDNIVAFSLATLQTALLHVTHGLKCERCIR